MRSSSASGIGLASFAMSRRIVFLRGGLEGAGLRVRDERVVPLWVASARRVEIEKGEAVEAFGVASTGADRKADGHVSETERHAVRADARCSVDDESSDCGAAAGGEPSGEGADERVRNDCGTLEAGELGNTGEPVTEGAGIETGKWSGLAEPGHVGHHDAVVARQTGEHRCPHGAPAFDGAVQQQESGAAAAGFDDGGGHAAHIDRAGGDR